MTASAHRHIPLGVVCVVVAVAAAVVSVGRVLLTAPAALSSLVWAEDGLFPLCVRVHGPVTCLVEPYAGYLLVLPRLVAWPVSAVPLGSWPFATNVAAALLAAAAAGLVVLVLRAGGVGWVCSVFLGMLPVVAPIMGVETINATASSYLLLPYVVCLALCVPSRRSFPTAALAVGAGLCVLTLPSSVVLLIPLAVQAFRRRIPVRGAAIVGGTLALCMMLQALAIMNASQRRSLDVTWDAVRSFVGLVPAAFVDPAVLDRTGEPALGLGLVVVSAATVLGVVLVLRSGPTATAVGLLLLSGLAFGLIPTLISGANNRYFVLVVLLWTAALFVGLDQLTPSRWREAVVAGGLLVTVVAFVPHLPASAFRATARPVWDTMLIRARLTCLDRPDGSVGLTFSPQWPEPSTVLGGATTNVVPCRAIDEFALRAND